MGRYPASLNKSAFTYESGLYGNALSTAQWVGLVQDFGADESQNVQKMRYHGTSTRSISKFVEGAEDYGGTIEFFPQDLRMMMFALGMGSDTLTGSPTYYTHLLTEAEAGTANPMTSGARNPFMSFRFQSAQVHTAGKNLIRDYKGCVVDNYVLSSEAGAPLTTSVNFFAQSNTFSSGTTLSPTEPSRRPYIWSDAIVHFPSGTTLDAKSWEISITNKIDRDGSHVSNGSRVIVSPAPTDRDYTYTITMEGESTEAARLYGLWQSGGLVTTNAGLLLNTVGNASSGVSWVALSGCLIDEFEAPNPTEGIDEWTLTLIPKNVTAVVQDGTQKYLAW